MTLKRFQYTERVLIDKIEGLVDAQALTETNICRVIEEHRNEVDESDVEVEEGCFIYGLPCSA